MTKPIKSLENEEGPTDTIEKKIRQIEYTLRKLTEELESIRALKAGAPEQRLHAPRIYAKAEKHISMQAPSIRLETNRLDVDGLCSARLCSTPAFSWYSGQPPQRMVHQSMGIPVLTHISGKFDGEESAVNMYVDPSDGYWYLSGSIDEETEITAKAICVGRV